MGLDALYDMTWGEFELRSEAYRQKEDKRREEYLFMIFNIKIAPHLDPKSLPSSFDAFKGKGAPRVDPRTVDFFNKEMSEFLELQKNGKP